MRLLGNILWFIFGGLVMGLTWYLVGVICMITIVGIPWAKACFMLGSFSFAPFGKQVVDRPGSDVGTGAFGTVGNIIWFFLAGIWLAIGHLASAISIGLTIVGIPFAVQHLKLAGASLAPIGKEIKPIPA